MEVPRFQEYAFDPKLGGRKKFKELREVIDGDDLGEVGSARGFQIKNIRTGYKKDVPDQLANNAGIQKLLLTAFPKLLINESQRQKAGRWAQVVKLHFQMGWSYTQVAEEMAVNPNVILMIIRGIKYTLDGKTWNGKPRKRV